MAVKHSAEVTVYDVTDAYSVTLTNEAASFKATSDTKMGTAGTAYTKPQAFLGTDAVACSVTAADCTRSDTTNVTVSVNSSGDNATWPLLTITVGQNATAGGTVTIPVVIGSGDNAVTIEKVFSYSIALKGTAGTAGKGISSVATTYQVGTSGTSAPTGTWQNTVQATTTGQFLWTRTVITFTDSTTSTSYSVAAHGSTGGQGPQGNAGKGISSTAITYQVGTSATSAPTGTWQNSPQATSTGQYLWTKTVVTYTDSTTSTSYSVAAHGTTGTAGGRWYSGTAITGTSTTATVFSGSGITSAVVGDMYLNTSTYNTYRCTVAGNASTAKWVYVNNVKGAKGDPGDDPYTLSITSDNGTVLKNNTGQTTLTAHVYQAGAELGTMPSGCSIKWYVDGTLAETDSSLPATFTRTAAQVANKCVVKAQLEG